MGKLNISEKFNIDDIRKIREYDNKRRSGMNAEELMRDVYADAEEGHKILEKMQNPRKLDA